MFWALVFIFIGCFFITHKFLISLLLTLIIYILFGLRSYDIKFIIKYGILLLFLYISFKFFIFLFPFLLIGLGLCILAETPPCRNWKINSNRFNLKCRFGNRFWRW